MTEQPSSVDVAFYEEKIRSLQENITGLRLSRRILMSLLEQAQLSQKEETEQLLRENRRLKQQTGAYAGQLWEKNRRIMELEKLLPQRDQKR